MDRLPVDGSKLLKSNVQVSDNLQSSCLFQVKPVTLYWKVYFRNVTTNIKYFPFICQLTLIRVLVVSLLNIC